ncbi:MAG: SGNH/GDSL hydrolase family protein [Kineosporiaceae bacterium]|nr:SGNH/GDSL hydrolase family protein [Kineosporiaceae bacterium]
MATYPGALPTFPVHQDGASPTDSSPAAVLTAAEVNNVQAEVVAIAAELGVNPSGTAGTVAERTAGQGLWLRTTTQSIARANRLMATLPTIGTLATSSAISGGVRFAAGAVLGVANAAPSRTYFTWLCGPVAQLGTAFPDYEYMRSTYVTDPYAGNAGSGAVEFLFDGTTLEVMTKGMTNTLWISVDDEYAHASPVSVPNDGNTYFLPVTFATRQWRKIRIEFPTQVIFGGVTVGTNDTVMATVKASPRVIVHGDSFSEGTGGGYSTRPWWRTLGNAVGWHDMWSTSLGGTGWLATGPSGRPKLRDRLASDVYPYTPDILILAGGFNDAASTQQQIQDEVTATLAAVKTNLPNTLIIVVAPFAATDVSDATAPWAIRDGVYAAASAAGVAYLDMLEPPLYGAGMSTTLAAQATSGASTVSLTAPVARTCVIKLGSQRRRVTGISGSGPYTATIAGALTATVANGAPVTEVGASLWASSNLAALVGVDGTHPTQTGSDRIGIAAAQQVLRQLVR